ncbi:aspartyl protease family protein [Chloroflexota bacterium]
MPFIRLDCPKTDTDFGECFYPEFNVEIFLASGVYQPFAFILDSGADCTLVPRDVANWVGFHFPGTPDASVTGIFGRPMPAYKGQLKLRIRDEELNVRCLFTESNRTPFLLGRVDFFSKFDIKFSGQNCHIVLKKLT